MDLPLSYVLYRALLGKRLDMLDVGRVDPQLGATLQRMKAALAAAATTAGGSGRRATDEIMLDGVPLSDLCLTFTLPGYPGREGGR